ncbi:hypothetical protein F969_00064, partial [Acinetobacter variabilis]
RQIRDHKRQIRDHKRQIRDQTNKKTGLLLSF